MKRISIMLVCLLFPIQTWAVYDLPNNDAGCPANCRQIPWSAGSDQWNGGTLPTYTPVTCTGLTEGNGTTNNATAIQTCINNLSANQAALIPPGIYYVNGTIAIPSNRVLRGSGSSNCSQGMWLSGSFPGDTGAGATCTTLKFGSNGGIEFGTSTPSRGTEYSISSGYTKGSQTLVMSTASHGFAVNDWISVFSNTDSAIVKIQGCDWCGENNGSNLIQQFVRVTSVNGTTVGISRPLYYTHKAENSPGAKEITYNTRYAGVEDLKINGFADTGSPLIYIRGLFCWVKNVETFNASGSSSAGHIRFDWSHGLEIRGSYLHQGRSYSSGDNYGIFGFFWNSDHKIEDNILRIHRHSTVLEGGGSGIAWLYNYIDDNFEDATDYLGSARTNHGPHPMFNLWEGNHISHLEADDVFGGSSHIVYFRNWLRGVDTDLADRQGTADWGFWAIDIRGPNRYYSAVGNVLGHSGWTSGTVRTTSSGTCGNDPIAYRVGCQDSGDWGSGYDSACSSTFIAHGNYDFITDGVAYWEGGADHILKNSMYYSSKPSFLGNRGWPPIGPDRSPLVGSLPAKDRFEGMVDDHSAPSPPENLTILE